MRKLLLISAFCLAASFIANAQNKDSLLQLARTAKTAKERLDLMYSIMDDASNNDPDKALYYHKKLLMMAQELNDKAAEAVAQNEIGWSLAMMGNRPLGTELMLKGVRLAEESGNQQAIGYTVGNLSIVHDDPVKQLEIEHRSLAAATAAQDHRFMCWGYYGLDMYYTRHKNYDSALYYAQQMLHLAVSKDVKLHKGNAMIRMARHSYRMGQKTLALEYLEAARREAVTEKSQRAIKVSYYSFVWFYTREQKPDSVLHYAKKIYASSRNSYYSEQTEAMNVLWKAYEGVGKPDSAFACMKTYNTMKDSLFSREKIKQVQAQLLINEIEQQKLTEERRNNIQYSAIALGLVVLLTGFLALSHSVVGNQKLIRFLGIISLLIVFEFLNLLLHPWLGAVTHHSPVLMLLAMVCVAALLIPLHHKLEHWITHKMVEKNNKIKLAAAKKIIASLEPETTNIP